MAGHVKLPPEKFTPKKQGEGGKELPTEAKKLPLNSAEELYAEIRDRNFNAVGAVLSKKAKVISAAFEVTWDPGSPAQWAGSPGKWSVKALSWGKGASLTPLSPVPVFLLLNDFLPPFEEAAIHARTADSPPTPALGDALSASGGGGSGWGPGKGRVIMSAKSPAPLCSACPGSLPPPALCLLTCPVYS